MKLAPDGEVSMNRAELLEAASQHLSRAIILLTAAGEDRLALAIEEVADSFDFPSKEGVAGGPDASGGKPST